MEFAIWLVALPGSFRMRCSIFLVILFAGNLLPNGGWAEAPLVFNRDIRPILSDYCFRCHGPDSASRAVELRLDEQASAFSSGAIVPGNPAASELIRRILATNEHEVMPPPEIKKPLTPQQKELLSRWIDQGADYQPHWAFLPIPKTVDVPSHADATQWVRQPIDAFVWQRLQKEGIQPSAETEKGLWLRRVTFDLTGLPPTLQELDTFLADQSPTAYETVVERLFKNPAYGERMANDWLDVARYADTFGYQADRDTHVWPWRDWVIRAFNQNLSYRDFVIWQTAGDMLPNPTRDQLLATTFNRLHRQTNEGGSIEAEFRAEYIADRVRTNGTAFLGLTFECARCHDHKYDPITQAEYYSLGAFLNNIDEHGLYSHFTETAPTPALLLYEGDQETRHQQLWQQIREQDQLLANLRQQASQSQNAESPSKSVKPPEPVYQQNFDDLKPAGDYQPVPGKAGTAIEFGGDDAFPCRDAPQLQRVKPFSLALWVKPGEWQPRQILVHQSRAAEDSAFRGFSLVLDNGIPEVSLVHFWPGNAIKVRGRVPLPEKEWTHLLLTYEGRSQANNLTLYVNGQAQSLEIVRDRLTRDFIHRAEWGDFDASGAGLALGARFRDVGFRGGAIDELKLYDVCLTALEVAAITGTEPPDPQAANLQHTLQRQNETYQQAMQKRQQLLEQENELIGNVQQIMTMRELPWRRPTYLLNRGAYDAPGEEVQPATPAKIFPFPEEFPKNRLGYAQWLVDERNPLTARVAVNRYWKIFFGQGLVANAEDFGSQGPPPTHPELLDWLARDLMDSGWDVQHLCRQIVLSATYRQSSIPGDPAAYQSDPQNLLLARGPRHRLSAEQIRDQMLAVSGLLVPTIGGPSVYPYQPEGLWEESGTNKRYRQSTGEGLYRRSLYTFWRRTSPPPTMIAFDAPSREFCLASRESTATPLQALVLLNDPQSVEAARVLSVRQVLAHPNDVPQQLSTLFRLLTSRQPSPDQLTVLTRLYNEQLQHYQNAPEKVAAFLKVGEMPHKEQANPQQTVSLAQVVLALFSYDECVMKR